MLCFVFNPGKKSVAYHYNWTADHEFANVSSIRRILFGKNGRTCILWKDLVKWLYSLTSPKAIFFLSPCSKFANLTVNRTIIFRLKTGHCRLLSHLNKIRGPHTDWCFCGTEPQPPDHILQSCSLLDQLRQITWSDGEDLQEKLLGSDGVPEAYCGLHHCYKIWYLAWKEQGRRRRRIRTLPPISYRAAQGDTLWTVSSKPPDQYVIVVSILATHFHHRKIKPGWKRVHAYG